MRGLVDSSTRRRVACQLAIAVEFLFDLVSLMLMRRMGYSPQEEGRWTCTQRRVWANHLVSLGFRRQRLPDSPSLSTAVAEFESDERVLDQGDDSDGPNDTGVEMSEQLTTMGMGRTR